MSYFWKDILSRLNNVHRTSTLLILIIPCLISLSVNSQNATLTNAVSSNNECGEEIRLICRGMGSLEVLFWFTNVIRLPINASDFTTEPSFISIRVHGSTDHYGYCYANGRVILNTTIVGVSQGKLKSDSLMAKFENLLNISLPYNRTTTWDDKVSYLYKIGKNEYSTQKFVDVFLEYKPSQGFDKIVTPTLLDNRVDISFSLERETVDLTWKTEVYVYIPDYIPETWFGWFGKEYSISLKELADYSGNIISSPNSTKSTLSIRFSIPGAFLQIFPHEEVRCLDIAPSEMNVSRRGEVFEKDITGDSVEDLYIRFKWVVPWWSLIGVTVLMLAVVASIIIFGISPLKFAKKIPASVWGFLFLVGLFLGAMSLSLIILNIVFLFNPSIAFNQYGWTGFGVWLGIWIAIAFVAIFPLAREVKKWREKRKEPKAWELEDQLKELKEQLGRGVITQEEYEQKKKKLLERSGK